MKSVTWCDFWRFDIVFDIVFLIHFHVIGAHGNEEANENARHLSHNIILQNSLHPPSSGIRQSFRNG